MACLKALTRGGALFALNLQVQAREAFHLRSGEKPAPLRVNNVQRVVCNMGETIDPTLHQQLGHDSCSHINIEKACNTKFTVK